MCRPCGCQELLLLLCGLQLLLIQQLLALALQFQSCHPLLQAKQASKRGFVAYVNSIRWCLSGAGAANGQASKRAVALKQVLGNCALRFHAGFKPQRDQVQLEQNNISMLNGDVYK